MALTQRSCWHKGSFGVKVVLTHKVVLAQGTVDLLCRRMSSALSLRAAPPGSLVHMQQTRSPAIHNTHARAHTHTHTHTRACTRVHARANTQTHTRARARTYVRVRASINRYMHGGINIRRIGVMYVLRYQMLYRRIMYSTLYSCDVPSNGQLRCNVVM